MTSADAASPPLLVRREDGVLWLVLNRPASKNAISTELREDMIAQMTGAGRDPDVRAVVVTGAGDAFCAGIDLGESPALSRAVKERDSPWEFRSAMRVGIHRIIRARWTIEKPVVAAVNGVAAGGAQIALACDVVVASSSARFIQIFVRRGLAVDSAGGWLLPRLAFLRRAKELVFLGDPLSAQDALAFGLVNRVVEEGELEHVAREIAGQLATSPGIGAVKMLMNGAFEMGLYRYLEREANLAPLAPDQRETSS